MSAEFLKALLAATSADPWTHGFAVVHRASGNVIGLASFKGPPGADGVVEIAYAIVPAHENQGYATEAAQALTSFAFARGQVRIVRAHTLPEANASGRVLTKSGFTRVADVIDPDDGPVWRWEQYRAGD
jgi:RimJ/RimL family protein N-acetyltransferase